MPGIYKNKALKNRVLKYMGKHASWILHVNEELAFSTGRKWKRHSFGT